MRLQTLVTSLAITLALWALGGETLCAQTVIQATIVTTAKSRKLPKNEEVGKIGDAVATLADRRKIVLSKSHLASQIARAADKKTVVWVEGSIDTSQTPHAYHSDRVVIWRDGKIVARLTPGLLSDMSWSFRDGGAKIVLRSSNTMGTHNNWELYDLATGKALEGYDDHNITGPAPAWIDGSH
jgi:hypothetical protein